MRKMKWWLTSILLVGLVVLSACEEKAERVKETDSNLIRIYDVEPQEGQDVVCSQHYARAGVLKWISNYDNKRAPFVNQIEAIEEESGAEIEYVVVGSWDELRREQEKFEDTNVTELVLFNNSYDESLLKEAATGRYADMEPALRELGFYEEEAYNQIVLNAGILEKGQVLVPIFYNVSGMIQGDPQRFEYEEWKKNAYNHAENAELEFEEFLAMLNEAMYRTNVETMELPFMSPSFLEDKVDLYLMAAGVNWEGYKGQEKLFTALYEYLKTYQQTQVDTGEDGISNQALYAKHLDEQSNTPMCGVPDDIDSASLLTENVATELKIESEDPQVSVTEMLMCSIVHALLNRTTYFTECTTAEEIAYHSVFGLLDYRMYYVSTFMRMQDFQIVSSGDMSYWPIGIIGAESQYAAQPICYVAMVEGGNTRMSAKVIQAMMNQHTDVRYGISVCNATKDWQLETWVDEGSSIGGIRRIVAGDTGGVETVQDSYWKILLQGGIGIEDKQIYAEQVRQQIDNLAVAQIPDRYLLAIWQDTLTEAVSSGLSAEAGFEMLCERMEAWY